MRIVLSKNHNISVCPNIQHIGFFFFAEKVLMSTWLISGASAGNPKTRLPQGKAMEVGGGSASGVSLGWSDMTVGEPLM